MTVKSELDRQRLSYIAFKYDSGSNTFQGYDGSVWKIIDNVRYNSGSGLFEGWNGTSWIVVADVSSEYSSRVVADSSLQGNINIEYSARLVADSSLQANVTSEASARIVMDSSLQANVTSEASARIVMDSSLQANVTSEASARIVMDSSLQVNITLEASARLVADSSLQASIISEASARLVADSSLQAAINSGGSGASLLDPNYDETFIYYTRSDFSIDKATFFGSTTGTNSITSAGKIILGATQNFISANLLGSVFLADNPVINTAQVRLLYNVGKVDNTFTFTVTTASATAGAVYTNGYYNYTVSTTLSAGTTLVCSGNGFMGTSGTLTKVSGTGDTTITYSACVFVAISVSADAGSNYTAATNTYISGRFIVADFTEETGTTSTDYRIKVVSNTASSELAGFGVNLVQDSVGAYGGDATFETRIITSTEATTGLITLTTVKFTPGAHQLHVIYSGHDFMAPTFSEIGGGAAQFPINFFTAGDTVYFYVAYGLVNTTNAALTLNNMLSSNSTLGSVAIPSGFTLDKPYMDLPSGAIITGAGNIETTGAITGSGTLALTGTVLSTGKAPTQPKYDRVEELTLGQGVQFPQGLRFGTKILNYYDEGTWTPTFISTGATFTYSEQFGHWLKLGKMVYVNFRLYASAAGTVTNAISLGGLPFAHSSTSAVETCGVTVGLCTWTAVPGVSLDSGATAFTFWQSGTTGQHTPTTSGLNGGLKYLGGSVSYIAAS